MISPKTLAVILVPVLAVITGLILNANGVSLPIVLTLSITLLTAGWWITEALPIPATSLVPFVLFPAAGVLTYQDAALGLGQHVILLLMGGCMIAKGIEKSNLHERIALGILQAVGSGSGFRLVFAFMLSSALLSMWISNTATCLVLMPIALAVLSQINQPRLAIPLVLGVAYACNLGGLGTLVGTPPNLIFAGVYEQISDAEFGFAKWMKIGLPIVVLGLPLIALWLARGIGRLEHIELPKPANWSPPEVRVLLVFAVIVFLWVFRLEPFGGWSSLVGFAKAGDSTVALLGVVLMFLIPSGAKKGDRLLDWESAVDIPWGMLLLFASGLTIAKAFQVSGTAELIGTSLTGVMSLPPYLLILSMCLAVSFLTEITSNTATTTLLMPILAAAASTSNLPIELLMIPAAISASCAFMLPVATAPNAIAYGTGQVSINAMMREGLILNLILAFIVSGVCYFALI